jgi:hypothetical protein
MPSLDEITHRVKENFNDLDLNKDRKISKAEFSKLQMPNLSEEQKLKAYEQISKADKDPSSISDSDLKETIKTLESRDKNIRFKEVGERLENIFGRNVAIPNTRDFNGVPSFQINAGASKVDAEKVIDKLVSVREKIGLSIKDLSFRSNENGNIIIDGGQILNFTDHGPDVISKVFEKLENPEITKQVRACFPERSLEKFTIKEVSDRLAKIFGVEPNYYQGVDSVILLKRDKTDNTSVVDELILVRGKLGLTVDDLGFVEKFRGNIGINAVPFLKNDRIQVEKVFKLLEDNAAELQNKFK